MKKIELKEQTLIARAQGGTVVITIPKKAGIKPGDTFSFIKYDDGSLAYTPENSCPQTLEELFKDWHDDGFRDRELNWGEAQGKELKW